MARSTTTPTSSTSASPAATNSPNAANRDLHYRPQPLKTNIELGAPKTLEEVVALSRAYIRRSTVALAPPAPSSQPVLRTHYSGPSSHASAVPAPSRTQHHKGASQGTPSSGLGHDQTFSRGDGATPQRRPMLQVPLKVVTGSPEDLSHAEHLPPRRW
jgi:hypothetical protein